MRISDRRTAQNRRPDRTYASGAGPRDHKATLVALAMILLLGLAAFPLLSDGRVLDNLGAGLRHWAGAKP